MTAGTDAVHALEAAHDPLRILIYRRLILISLNMDKIQYMVASQKENTMAGQIAVTITTMDDLIENGGEAGAGAAIIGHHPAAQRTRMRKMTGYTIADTEKAVVEVGLKT